MKILIEINSMEELVGLEEYVCKCRRRPKAQVLNINAIYLSTGKVVWRVQGMALPLQDIEKVALTIAPVDAAGNPAKVDGAPVWVSSDSAVVEVVAATDGLSAVATAVGPLGSARVTVTADADLGSGIEEISGFLDIEVGPSKAVSLAISAGTPEPK